MINSSKFECSSSEEVFGGKSLSQIGEEAFCDIVYTHRSSKKREFRGNFCFAIDLRCYSQQR